MAHANVELMEKAYDAFNKGDMDFLRNEVFDPNIVGHFPGKNSLSGDYKGVDEVLSAFQQLFERTGGTFSSQAHAILGDDEHVTVLSKASGEKDGKSYAGDTIEVYHFAGGKMTEFWTIDVDQYAWDAFIG